MVAMCQKISEPIEQRLSIGNVDELDFINSIADKVAQVSHVHAATCSGIVLDFYRVLQDVKRTRGQFVVLYGIGLNRTISILYLLCMKEERLSRIVQKNLRVLIML